MSQKPRHTIIIAIVFQLASNSIASAGQIYFAGLSGVGRINTDGTGLQMVTTGDGSRGVSVDLARSRLYWSDVNADAIFSVRLDLTDQSRAVSTSRVPNSWPFSVDHHDTTGQLFWGDQGNSRIFQASGSGGTAQEIVFPFDEIFTWSGIRPQIFNRYLAIDSVHDRLYWTFHQSPSAGKIFRSNLDGTAPEVVFEDNLGIPSNIVLDVVNDKLYWTDRLGSVRRANLDGSGAEYLARGGIPGAIALDTQKQILYWADVSRGAIMRMNSDGSSVEIAFRSALVSDANEMKFVICEPACGMCGTIAFIGWLVIRRSFVNRRA